MASLCCGKPAGDKSLFKRMEILLIPRRFLRTRGGARRVNRMSQDGRGLAIALLFVLCSVGRVLRASAWEETSSYSGTDLDRPVIGLSLLGPVGLWLSDSDALQPAHLSRSWYQDKVTSLRFVQLEANNIGRPSNRSSWWSRLLSPFQTGAEKVSSFFKEKFGPRTEPTFKEDAISLSRPAKPSTQLYVALARLAEQQQRLAEAEQYYEKALQISPKDVEALLGYARLKDLTNDPEAAARLYRRALDAHPHDPAVHNDWALFLVRRGQVQEAAQAMESAIRLQPRRWLYRNNMAIILVQMGQYDRALSQLLAVQDPATACHNLGYILFRRGDIPKARYYFQLALEHNPRFEPAQRGLAMVAESQSGFSPAPYHGETAMASPASELTLPLGGPLPRLSEGGNPSELYFRQGPSERSFFDGNSPPVSSVPALPPSPGSSIPVPAPPGLRPTF